MSIWRSISFFSTPFSLSPSFNFTITVSHWYDVERPLLPRLVQSGAAVLRGSRLNLLAQLLAELCVERLCETVECEVSEKEYIRTRTFISYQG